MHVRAQCLVLAAIAGMVVQAFGQPATAPAVREAKGAKLMLSEVTMDNAPGREGSWVELYNASAGAVDAGGIRLVMNEMEVFAGPEQLTVPAHGLLLIAFGKKHPVFEETVEASFRFYNAAVIEAKVVDPSPVGRAAGSCAVFHGAVKEENLWDFVWWGQKGKAPEHLAWATKGDMWSGEGLYIGDNAAPGGRPVRQVPAVLSRMAFLSSKVLSPDGSWDMVSERKATPGAGNRISPPGVFGDAHASDTPFSFTYGSYLSPIAALEAEGGPLKEGDVSCEVEVAADPHFLHVVYRGVLPAGPPTIREIKPGDWYVRIRYNGKRLESDWSEGAYLRYYEGPK